MASVSHRGVFDAGDPGIGPTGPQGPAGPAGAGGADIRDFGAVVDAADNTAAIQSAIEAVFAEGGGAVEVPPGEWLTSKLTLRDNVTLRGQGGISYALDTKLGSSILTLNNDTDIELVSCAGATGPELRDLVLRGRPASPVTNVGVRMTGGSTVTVQNCRITRFKGAGVYSESNGIHRLLECIISYNGGAGVDFNFGVADCMIGRCYINANTGHGVYLGGGSNANYLVANRIEWNDGNGVLAYQAHDVQFVANQLDRNQRCGLRIGGGTNNWSIAANRFKRNAPNEPTSSEQANVYLEQLTNSTLSGNSFERGTDDGGGGILSPVFGVAYGSCTDLRIIGNSLRSSTTSDTAGTELKDHGSNVRVRQAENMLTGVDPGSSLENFAPSTGITPSQARHNVSSYGGLTSANLLYLANPNDSNNSGRTKGFLFRLDKTAVVTDHASLVLSEFRGFNNTTNLNGFIDSDWSDGFTFSNGQFAANGGLKAGAAGTLLTQTAVYTPSLTPASCAANTTAEQTFTVAGLTTADTVFVNPPASMPAGLGIVGVRVSAADTLAIRFGNHTAGGLTPVSGVYRVVALRS